MTCLLAPHSGCIRCETLGYLQAHKSPLQRHPEAEESRFIILGRTMDLAIRQAVSNLLETCFHTCSDSLLCLPAGFALPFARLTSEVAEVGPARRSATASVSSASTAVTQQ